MLAQTEANKVTCKEKQIVSSVHILSFLTLYVCMYMFTNICFVHEFSIKKRYGLAQWL